MSKKLTIGVLLSNSTILPMSKSFNSGLKEGLKALQAGDEWEVEIIPEFIGQGSKELAEKAINKLSSFDNADIITGIVSNKVGYELGEKFEKLKCPFIINNIGEHLPDPRLYNNHVFLNSVHTWQQAWSIGNWAVKNFGKKGMFVSGLYDCGYSFQSLLHKGMEAAAVDAQMPFAIAPLENFKGLADVASVIPRILEFEPDFVFATFCGEEASIFLSEYVKSGLHNKIPLLGLPFLLESFEAKEEKIEFYTTISANREVLAHQVEKLSEFASNPFSQFGYETGLLINEAVKKASDTNISKALAEIAIESERGRIEVMPQQAGKDSRVFLIKNTFEGDKNRVSRELIAELDTIDIENEAVTELNNQPSSGWVNPYLGI